MPLQLYNSLTRQKEVFTPNDPERVTMYVCGPTVYNYAHIGNARPAVVFDLLYRLLQMHYPNVVYARNITDVDDKIIKAASEQGIDCRVITEKYTKIYRQDMAALNVSSPTVEPKATEHIDEMVNMIAALVDNGHAYAAEGHVLFEVKTFADYGKLSNRNVDDMIAGARVEVAPYKKDPMDFVLWKPSDPDQVGWDSPWGYGRPGWHLECSAMIETHLGDTIDIHGGGHDLQFPHHENEIAQGTCAHGGKTYCNTWLHNGFVNLVNAKGDAEKMSKSEGNVLLVHDLIEQYPGEVIRLALLTAQYRQPLDWSDHGLQEARKKLDRLYTALRSVANVPADTTVALPSKFLAALNDDLNTPEALAECFALAKAINKAESDAEKQTLKSQLQAAGDLLGLLQHDPAEWLQQANNANSRVDAAAVDALIAERETARTNKDWARADEIRDELNAMKIVLEDSVDGVTWRVG